jgi:hypothetical protein
LIAAAAAAALLSKSPCKDNILLKRDESVFAHAKWYRTGIHRRPKTLFFCDNNAQIYDDQGKQIE